MESFKINLAYPKSQTPKWDIYQYKFAYYLGFFLLGTALWGFINAIIQNDFSWDYVGSNFWLINNALFGVIFVHGYLSKRNNSAVGQYLKWDGKVLEYKPSIYNKDVIKIPQSEIKSIDVVNRRARIVNTHGERFEIPFSDFPYGELQTFKQFITFLESSIATNQN